MILIWVLILIWSGWEFGPRRNLTWTALFLICIWSAAGLIQELSKPEEELIIYQGKKGNMFDFSSNGKMYSWNQGLESEEISFIADPNRIANHWSQFPEEFSAGKREEGNLVFPFHTVSFSTDQKQLYFLQKNPISIQIWEGNQWKNMVMSDSLELGEKGFRILF